jgi:GNAT superfamily N-acetyltransferase
LSCHYDILEWLDPDWIFDTATGKYSGRCLRRPKFELEIYKTNWRYWPVFEPHHYLKAPPMIASQCYIGTVDGELVCHLGVGCKNKGKDIEARACRLVVMPEWQGAGVGLRFLNQICQWNLEGAPGARFPGRPVTTLFHTSHPGLCAALRRDHKWRQVSARLYGGRKLKSRKSIAKGSLKIKAGYGGHFRAVQGFRYIGARNNELP